MATGYTDPAAGVAGRGSKRPRRRFDPSEHAHVLEAVDEDRGDNRTPSAESARFLELAAERFGAIQRDARAAVHELTHELDHLIASASDPDTAAELRAIGEALAEHRRNLADWSRSADEWLQGESDAATASGPSETVLLVVNQLALAGASEAKMVSVLTGLGVDEPEAAIAQALEPRRLASG